MYFSVMLRRRAVNHWFDCPDSDIAGIVLNVTYNNSHSSLWGERRRLGRLYEPGGNVKSADNLLIVHGM